MPPDIIQNIRIQIQAIAKNTKVLNDTRNLVQQVNQAQRAQITTNKENLRLARDDVDATFSRTKRLKGFRETLFANTQTLRDWRDQGAQGITTTSRLALNIRRMTTGLKGFQFHMLGVLFFGMALQRMFLGLLQPAFKTAGIFELIGTTLEILFLPIALLLLDVLLPILEFFMNLPDSIKLAIGVIALAGAAFGTLLLVIGTVALGVASLIIAFIELISIGPEILVGIAAVFGGITTALFGMVFSTDQAKELMKKDFGIILDSGTDIIPVLLDKFGELAEGLPQPIKDALEIFAPALDLIKALFEGDFEKISEIVSGIVSDLIDTLKNFIIDGIKEIFRRLENLPEPIGSMVKLFRNVWEGVLGFLQEASQIRSIEDAIDFVIKHITKFGEWGVHIAEKMVAAIVAALPERLKTGIDRVVDQVLTSPIVSGGGFPTLPSLVDLFKALGVAGFQHGGIVTRPTLGLVGEAGPEAVIPLNRLGEGGFGGFSGDINIFVTANPAVGVTADEIATTIERKLGDELRRLSR